MKSEQADTPGVVIVGAGHSGGRAAERLRAFGYDKPITVIGQESHRPYERPPLSKAVLTAKAPVEPPFLLTDDKWTALQVKFLPNTSCLSIDRATTTVTLSTGVRLAYEKLVLATGLAPGSIPQLSLNDRGICCVNAFDDAALLRSHLHEANNVVIVGAGFIGLEVAASARQLGAAVTIIEIADRPLQRMLPMHLSNWIADWHRDRGVDIRCGRRIASHKPDEECHLVTLDDDSELKADLIVIGIGGKPRVDLAARAGLCVNNGVTVDAQCRSSDRNIYAIGDIAHHHPGHGRYSRRLESWKNAEDSAAIAAKDICGEPARYDQIPWFWTDQFGNNLQMTGEIPDHADIYERGRIGESGYLAFYTQEEQLIGAFGIDCGGDIRKARGHIEKSRPVTRAILDKAGLSLKISPNVSAAEELSA
ncbi:MAG: FAD-dependent oxidoreductase [Alphaproteobacteria bacterium]|nr:FAD-dependent oxidoreductase [Alphaproteobacteria bacterium]